MAAHQAPPSLGFSRQEHWSGLPFPSPMHESESEVAQSCPTLSNPMDCSPRGSSVHGIFQARVLQWGAIAFSKWSTGSEQAAVQLPCSWSLRWGPPATAPNVVQQVRHLPWGKAQWAVLSAPSCADPLSPVTSKYAAVYFLFCCFLTCFYIPHYYT